MKRTILLLATFLLSGSASYSQSFLLTNVPGEPQFEASNSNFVNDGLYHRGLCTVTKVGLIALGASGLSMEIGFDLIFTPNSSEGAWLFAGGFVLFFPALGMVIGGGIHDIVNRHKQRWSIIAPKRNQLGFAYNF